MSRLIDADALIVAIYNEWDGACVWDASGAETADKFGRLVEAQPTIEPEWKPPKDTIYKIVGCIIETGQHDHEKFRLGETIRYTPSEILEILEDHADDLFSIEPERKKGHWIVCDILQEVKCSECRMCFRHKAKFCPNCKADMRGETDERER